jgi:hypothetical protein
VYEQEEGQAFWIYKGHAQHVMTAPVPITPEQVQEGWREIRRQEEMQRQQLEREARRRQEQQAQKKQSASASTTSNEQQAMPSAQKTPRPGAQKNRTGKSSAKSKAKQQ